MGGDNAKTNIVSLTAEEHYVAHQLLVKMYPGVPGLVVAAVRMARQCTGNKAYGWLRRLAGEAVGNRLRGIQRPPRSVEWIEKLAAAKRGSKQSAETRAKISIASRAMERARCSPETKAKIAAAQRGKVCSAETRAKMAAARKGKKRSADAIEKARASNAGYKHSDETKEKLRMIGLATQEKKRQHKYAELIAAGAAALLIAGCATKPTVSTQVIEKLVPVPCEVKLPDECKDSYAVDRVSPSDSPVTINRALRAEIEERWSCEIKLRAALRGCNS
jgi:hypothetical protein